MCFFCAIEAWYPKGFYFPVHHIPGPTAADRFDDLERQIQQLLERDK